MPKGKESPKSPKRRSGSPGKLLSGSSKAGSLNLINDLDPAVYQALKNTNTVTIASLVVNEIMDETQA